MLEETDELRAEIARLSRENEDLKSRSKSFGAISTSIEGLETFAMRIGPDESILHLNTSFSRYLGVARREELVGQKAAVLRRFLNQEMLMAIARPAEGQSLMRVARDDHAKVYEIKTTLRAGMLDVVMQDVTDEQQFRSLVQRYVLKDFDNLSEEDLRTFRFPERRFMSFTFTDLRGFTALSEKLSPEEVRGMVNAFYEEAIGAVEENDATVIQLIGDEVMAFYGAPRYFKDHALRAVKTACEQVEKVNELCERYARAGKQMCPCGVGINSGDVVLGNMGGAGKQSYTALGPAVNLASRICGAAQGGQVLLTEAVLKSALEALPPGWEMMESHTLLGDDVDLSKVGGKIEDVQPLPEDLRGKVISIGPGLTSQQNSPAYTFRYLYLLKPKGAKELPIMTVVPGRQARKSGFLSEERATIEHAEMVIGKYHIVEPIGEGGMGKVWKARDQFGNVVAIKMLSAGHAASSSQLQRFKREAAVMGKLSHHNICRIHEIGEAEGATFIAMEFVDGVSLGDVIRHNVESLTGARVRSSVARKSELTDLVSSIKQEKKAVSASRLSAGASGAPTPIPAPAPAPSGSNSASGLTIPMQRVLAMMSDICEAVQFAHDHGVLHRDLKPDNIMLRPDGDPVVTDFGLAKLENDPAEFSLSLEGQIVGTIEYMAPEQAQSSKHVTERADVYSLGAIFYQLLTGRKHFTSSGSLMQDAQTLQEYESPPLRQFNKEIDRDLATIVLKALRPTPVQRYTSVRHMVEDLKRYQAGDSITARAPTIVDRVVKRVRKHRTPVLFSAALILVALIFGGYALFEYRKQWGDWTKEFAADFSSAPVSGAEQTKWLQERFAFQDKEARAPAEPWTLRDGALVMKQHEWCWLENVRIRDDTKVFVELSFKGKPEAFQIALNSRRRLRQAENNPAGYACRVGIWGGSMDLITRNERDRPNDFNGLVVSSLPKALGENVDDERAASSDRIHKVSLAFQRQGEKVTLQINGREVHQETYVMPLLAERDEDGGGRAQYENIGIRTWGKNVEVRSISAYRFKLPEKASPTVAGDALAETGHLQEAITEYRTVATDYAKVSPAIAGLALFKGYLLANYRGDFPERRRLLTELQEIPARRSLFRKDLHAERLQKVLEAETLARWKDGDRGEALLAFEDIFKADPETRIVLECLRAPHEPLAPAESAELLRWTAQTTRLAGLNLRGLGLTDLTALASISTLRGLDIRNNQLSSLEPVRAMRNLRALYVQQNQITSLEPLQGLKLSEFFSDGNRIESLAPLKGMPLETFYCSRNQISDLSPLAGQPLYVLGCAENRITSLAAVAEMPSLGQLYCSRNQISDLSPLKGSSINTLDCAENGITSLEAAAEMASLNQLYCSQNQIPSLEPLRRAHQLQYLDCSFNQITSLTPLAGLKLKDLNCSKNPLVSLEPFVSEIDPPPAFAFDCDTLPNEEIERAIAAWSAKGLKFHVSAAQLLRATRAGRFDEIRALASEQEGHRYLYVQKLLNAEEAAKFASRVGGHLVTIGSEKENAYLKQITPPGVTCRTGLLLEAGKPRWITGEPIGYVPEQMEFRPQDKFTMWRAGWWDASRRDKPLPFIVEWD